MPKSLLHLLPIVCAASLLGAAAGEPTVLRGVVRDPIDDSRVAGALVTVGSQQTRTDATGTFEIRVQRKRPAFLATRFEAEGYLPYRTWTERGTETARTIYLFPDRPVQLYEHDDPVTAAMLREEFDIVYRDPIWHDPWQRSAWLWRWGRQPEIWINTRVTAAWEDGGRTGLVATSKVPGRVRRYVRDVIAATIGPLTGGVLEAGRIRFRRLRRGQEITSREIYRPGQINVLFHNRGFYDSGGGHIIAAHQWVTTPAGDSLTLDLDACRRERSLSDCLTIVSGAPAFDVESLVDALEDGNAQLVKHEFAHVLGMQHRMLGTHPGSSGPTILCSIMGGPCDQRSTLIGDTTHVDRVLARLAYTRAPGNDRNDQDPYPGGPDTDTRDSRR